MPATRIFSDRTSTSSSRKVPATIAGVCVRQPQVAILLQDSTRSTSHFDIMKNDVLRHLFTGFVRLHILYHAAKEPICGVEIMEELRHHGYKIGPGTLYPILHGLQQAGYLRGRDQVVNGKRRKNFRTTSRGQRLLADARDKLEELTSEIIRDEDARALRKKS